MDGSSQKIKPDNYDLITNPQTGQIITEGSCLMFQCKNTDNIIAVSFDQVSNLFNLEQVEDEDGTVSYRFKSAETIGFVTSPPAKGIKEWDVNETKRIIQLVTEYTHLIGPMKRFATKKAMWAHIASKISNEFYTSVTPTQVENRMKTVSKINKKRVEHNRQSGNARLVTPYDLEFDLLSQKDPTIDPALLTQDGQIAGGSGSKTLDATSSSAGGVSMGGKTNADGPEESGLDEDVVMTDQGNKTGKEEKKKRRKKNNLAEIYLNQCELRANDRDEQRREKELAKAKAENDKMERFMIAQQRKDERHAEKVSLLKDLIGVLKSKNRDDYEQEDEDQFL